MSVQSEVQVAHDVALLDKIENHTARVGVIGLGYVGLPLAVEMARVGFPVTGIDLDTGKVGRLVRGENYIEDVDSDLLRKLVTAKKFTPTTDFSVIRELDTINICVPTPLRKPRTPT